MTKAIIASDYNLQTINTVEYAANLKATIDFGGSLLAIAQKGSGKTAIARDVIAKAGYKELYVNISTKERVDLGGFPDFFNNKKDKFINYLFPSMYRHLMEGDKLCVAVFDEIDKAESGLLSPLLEFIQERSMDGNPLKNLHAIVMMGNLPGEGGTRPPAPLLDRTEKFLVEVNPIHWLEWAGSPNGNIHSSITAYISDNLEDLCDEVDQGENYSARSPRGWDNASQLLTYGERHKWDPKMLLQKVSACIGKKSGVKYAAYFEHYRFLLPLVRKITDGEKVSEFSGFERTKQMIVCMMLCATLSKMLDEIKTKSKPKSETDTYELSEEAACVCARVAKFLAANIDPEMAMIAIRGQLGPQRILDFDLVNDANWDRIFTEFKRKLA